MAYGTSTNSKQFSLVVPAVTCAVACALWVALIPIGNEGSHLAESRTRDNLETGAKLIEQFARAWRTTPTSMAELRAFAHAQGVPFSSFDAFGNRLQYVRLSIDHYLLRSFGADHRQHSIFTDQDPYVAKWPEPPQSTPSYRFLTEPQPAIYPSPVILGIHSPNLDWYSEIFTDQLGGSRRLVVRNPRKDRFLVAPHDLVEEFLWLPNSFQIIYTATSSVRYRDGIYLWNILTDETVNLLDRHDRNPGLYPTNQERRYFLSLGGVTATGSELMVYVAPAISDVLNPRDFLSTKQLFEVSLPAPGIDPHFRLLGNGSGSTTPLDHHLQIGSGIQGKKDNDPVYREWLALRLAGNLEQVIDHWQQFSEKHADSPILPYCLWYLSSIYNDAHVLVAPIAEKDSAVLRAYGAELADALSQLPSTPSYLRAFGNFIYESLTANVPLPYQVSRLSLPVEPDDSGG